MANVTELEDGELAVELAVGDLAFPSIYVPRRFPGDEDSPLKHNVVMVHDIGDQLDWYCRRLGVRQGEGKTWAEGRLTANASSMIAPEVDTVDPSHRRLLAELFASLPSRNLTGDALVREYPCTVIVRPFDYKRGDYQGRRKGTALGLRRVLLDLSTVRL